MCDLCREESLHTVYLFFCKAYAHAVVCPAPITPRCYRPSVDAPTLNCFGSVAIDSIDHVWKEASRLKSADARSSRWCVLSRNRCHSFPVCYCAKDENAWARANTLLRLQDTASVALICTRGVHFRRTCRLAFSETGAQVESKGAHAYDSLRMHMRA